MRTRARAVVMGENDLNSLRLLLISVLLAAPFSALAQECRPTCRTGFVCVDGVCVSECNPPCAAGEVCKKGDCHVRGTARAPHARPEPTLLQRDVAAAKTEIAELESELDDISLGGSIGLLSAGCAVAVAGISSGAFLIATDELAFGSSDPFAEPGARSSDVEEQRRVGWIVMGAGAAVGGTLIALGAIGLRSKVKKRRPLKQRIDELEDWLEEVEEATEESGLKLEGVGVDPGQGLMLLQGSF